MKSKCSPNKRELLTLVGGELKHRPLLLSLRHNDLAVTDHRHLLGIIRKLDLENERLLAMRIKVEEFQSRRIMSMLKALVSS